MTKTIYLLRHCSTKDSELGINGSRTDTPLSENGLAKARNLVSKLSEYKFDLVIVSPLQRTSQTIEPFINSLTTKPKIIVEPITIERDLGILTNTVSGDGKVPESIRVSGKSKTEWTPPEGESTQDVYERAKQFLIKIKEIQENSILICGHQNFLRCLELAINNKELNDETYYSETPPMMEFGEIRAIKLP